MNSVSCLRTYEPWRVAPLSANVMAKYKYLVSLFCRIRAAGRAKAIIYCEPSWRCRTPKIDRFNPADAIKWIRFMLDKPSGLFAIPFYTASRDLTLRRLSTLNLLFCLSSDRQV